MAQLVYVRMAITGMVIHVQTAVIIWSGTAHQTVANVQGTATSTD